jgi:hypothetical protein
MCNSLQYQGRWYQTPSELAEVIGGADRLVWQAGGPQDMDSCLCPVDLEATLTNAGFRWSRGVDPMEWFAERR